MAAPSDDVLGPSSTPDDKEARIAAEVFRSLRTLTPRGTLIQRSDRVIDDLKLLSDDATAMAFDVERTFRVDIPQSEWDTVFTVQDVIDLLMKHVR